VPILLPGYGINILFPTSSSAISTKIKHGIEWMEKKGKNKNKNNALNMNSKHWTCEGK
jgi:hypothetical protein